MSANDPRPKGKARRSLIQKLSAKYTAMSDNGISLDAISNLVQSMCDMKK